MTIKFYKDLGDAPGFIDWIEPVVQAVTNVQEAIKVGSQVAVAKALRDNAFTLFSPFVEEPTDPEEVRAGLHRLSLNELIGQFKTVQDTVGDDLPKSKDGANSATGSEGDAASASPGSTYSGKSPSASANGPTKSRRPSLKKTSAST